ncbi:alpha/beta hydrolase family protein [Salinimicrobium sp. GXAS 041]|uniref:alpha/beta hydrolase family protein n=1 Tax=Salinimicrobium sp. GXAS 041 TaxID=3400806 RepID=UPI003C779F41
MVIKKIKNIPLQGKHGRPVVTDVFYSEKEEKKPVLIFCHGYKGFKDWGTWNLMAEEFAGNGFMLIKFNFSFNGGTLEQPIDFPDLDAFSENTFLKELDDLDVVLDWVSGKDFPHKPYADTSSISLIGHSRGGGTVTVKAAEDDRVTKLITLASISDFGNRFPSGPELEAWKENGIAYVENSRTKQQMPHLYSFYTNFKENEERLTISRAAKQLEIPFLIIHGTADPTVNVDNAQHLKEWNPNAELFLLEGSNHVFEGIHPWSEKGLPDAFKKIVARVTQFVRE